MSGKSVLKTSLSALKTMKSMQLETGAGSHLPEPYKKFWREWKFQEPAAVHFIPQAGKWTRNPETGQVTPVQNVPIPLKFSPEMENMLLGGERIIKGFVKPKQLRRRVPRWWLPVLRRSVVYSEILDAYMPALMTGRLLQLIHEHHGFDNYILKTPACDLHTLLSIKLKRKILLALATGSCYPDNPQKRDEILRKYADHIPPLEEAEWYGLTWKEAMIKHHLSQQQEPRPLKHQFRQELLQQLREMDPAELEDKKDRKLSWLSNINPFASKETSKHD